MSNFQQYIGSWPQVFPAIDLTALPGVVYDFGSLTVPAGWFASSAGPATGQFDNQVTPTTSNIINVSGQYVFTTSGAPTSGSWAPPQLAYDVSGASYGCKIAGTPGVWVTLTAPAGSFAPLPVAAVNPLTGWFHVTGFGAKGDGVTDDAAAIQAAIDAARGITGTGAGTGAGVVYFPFASGSYLIGSALITDAHVRLVGQMGYNAGKTVNTLLKAKASGTFTNGPVADKWMIKPPVARNGDGSAPNWWWHGGSVENLALDCNTVAGLGGMMLYRPGENSVIERMHVRNSGSTARTIADGVTTSGSVTVTSATAAFTADDLAAVVTGAGVPPATGRTVADGVTTSGSPTVTSATANFTVSDLNGTLTGTGIPGGATITLINSATSVNISVNATATASSVSITATQLQAARIARINSATSVDLTLPVTATATGVSLTINSPKPGVQFEASAATGYIRSLNGAQHTGPLLRLKNQGSGSWVIESLSGDSNGGGLLQIDGGGVSLDPISVTLINFKAENYTAPGRMDPIILLHNCGTLALQVMGASAITSYTEQDVIRVDLPVGNGPSVGTVGLEGANPFNTSYLNIVRNTATGAVRPVSTNRYYPFVLAGRDLSVVTGRVDVTGDPMDLTGVTGNAVAAASNIFGDKLALIGRTFGFGAQSQRLVAYVSSGSAFVVRQQNASGNASSGTNDSLRSFTNGHLELPAGTAPTAAALMGTSPPATVLNANARDQRGSVTFGTGSGTMTAAAVLTVTFNTAWTVAPFVQITATTGATAALVPWVSAVSTTAFTVSFNSAPAASQANTVYGIAWTAVG